MAKLAKLPRKSLEVLLTKRKLGVGNHRWESGTGVSETARAGAGNCGVDSFSTIAVSPVRLEEGRQLFAVVYGKLSIWGLIPFPFFPAIVLFSNTDRCLDYSFSNTFPPSFFSQKPIAVSIIPFPFF